MDFNKRLPVLPKISQQLQQQKQNAAEILHATTDIAESQYTAGDSTIDTSGAATSQQEPDCEPALRIISHRRKNNKTEFYVEYADGTKAWSDFVTPLLLKHYRLAQ